MDGANEEHFEPAPLDLYRYLDLGKRYWWLVVLFAGAGAIAGYAYQSRDVPYFQASASIVVRVEAPQVLGKQVDKAVEFGDKQWSADRQTFYDSQISIMKSAAVAKLSAKIAKLDAIDAIAGVGGTKEIRMRRAAQVLRGSIQITHQPSERLMWVTATHRDPNAAEAMANAVIRGYEVFNFESYRRGNAEATKWLEGELAGAETELDEANAALADFRQQNRLLSFSLDNQRGVLANKVSHFSQGSTQAKSTRLALEAKYAKLKAASEIDVAASPIFDVAQSETGRALRSQLIEELVKREALAVTYGPKHQAIIEQNGRIADLRKALKNEINQVLSVAQTELQKAIAIENKLEGELGSIKEEVFALGPQQIQYEALTRKRDEVAQRARYLRERYNENNMVGRLQASNLTPLDPATVRRAPRKGTTYFVMGGGAGGLLIALLLIGGISHFDSRIRNVGEIEAIAGERFLGTLPAVEETDYDRARLVEAMRIVHTNMSFLSPDHRPKVVMVTSPQPKDGKSTSSYRLAATMAEMGKKVLLVDADMRNPSLHLKVGVPRREGLSELIAGTIDFSAATRSTEVPTLFLMPAGRPTKNPVEALQSQTFARLIETVSEEYDAIVIDTPPILPVVDASIISRVADQILFVTRCGQTERSALPIALKQIERTRPSSMGIVANCVGLRAANYYYKGYDRHYAYDSIDAAAATAKARG